VTRRVRKSALTQTLDKPPVVVVQEAVKTMRSGNGNGNGIP
jgi:hypothetical protein